MKTITVTERVGEDVGPIDWSHPMIAEELAKLHNGKAYRAPLIELLRAAEPNPNAYVGTTDGGWPRCGWGRVLAVRMYDGWPYWQPTPSVLLASWSGASWHSFASLSEVRLEGPEAS